MSTVTHQRRAAKIIEQLSGQGLSDPLLRRLAVFSLNWGTFERLLEPAIWALKGEQVRGRHPSTDRRPVGDLIKIFGESATSMSEDVQPILTSGCESASYLARYRNAILHGWLVPSDTLSTFLLNPRFHGEQRKRSFESIHVSENLLDIAIDSCSVLCQMVFLVSRTRVDSGAVERLRILKDEIGRVQSQLFELEHLAKMVEHEKY